MFMIRAKVWMLGFAGEMDWTEWRTFRAGSVQDAVTLARRRWPEAVEVQVVQRG